jgi:hypothetical protein
VVREEVVLQEADVEAGSVRNFAAVHNQCPRQRFNRRGVTGRDDFVGRIVEFEPDGLDARVLEEVA